MSELNKQERFLELFEPVRIRLSLYARAMTRNSEDAKDLIGDTILAAYENLDKVREPVAFASYIFSIASNANKRKHRRLRIFGPYNESLAEQIPDTSIRLESIVDTQFLYLALDKLPAKQKEAVVLFEISGFALEEIKKIQGGTLSGVKSRIKRGREQLAVLMGVDSSPKKFDDTADLQCEPEAETAQVELGIG